MTESIGLERTSGTTPRTGYTGKCPGIESVRSAEFARSPFSGTYADKSPDLAATFLTKQNTDQPTGFLSWSDCIGDKGRTMDAICMDFCKTFDTVPYNILLSKLEREGFDGWTVQWTRNYLDSHTQRIMVNGSVFQWALVTRSIPQGPLLGPVLFSVFINDINKEIKCTLSKFPDDTMTSGAAETPEGRDAIHRNVDKIKKYAILFYSDCLEVGRVFLFEGETLYIKVFLNEKNPVPAISKKYTPLAKEDPINKVYLDGIAFLQNVNCTTQLGVTYRIPGGALSFLVHVINKDVQQDQIQY
ncbi:hypothetical protein HGM15179_013216 [Zosterops borbonicus]|uniref:Reverse transcriptase domain-containing protein n=1 Tax=Zosterops borbonicus TaxID=364589 RepID=A0A8K1LHG4_9PASS|nr:hypothetical protein HGM15179_013216 [Zosterops borbonicus]